ncbi:ABC transporter permease [Brucellaceae bacterium D45D]
MIGYFLGKLVGAVLSILGVLTIVFFVTRIFGDPTLLLLPIGAGPEDIARFKSELGLDQPLLNQYFLFLADVIRGDFGISFQHGRPALTIVLERMPATIELAASGLVLGVIIGAVAGAVAALRRGTIWEFLVMLLTLLGQATPTFWLGIILILVFAVQLGFVPTGGAGGFMNLILPSLAIAVFVAASIARLLRSSILDVLNEDFVRTARAQGLMPRTVFFWHVARNSLIPVVTMIGIIAGELLGGSVVTETVFAWPGIGRLIVQAIAFKDFPVILAGVAVIATLFVIINFCVDLLYGLLDPRIRVKG